MSKFLEDHEPSDDQLRIVELEEKIELYKYHLKHIKRVTSVATQYDGLPSSEVNKLRHACTRVTDCVDACFIKTGDADNV